MVLGFQGLGVSLKALKLAGVHGVVVEIWWGVVERFSPLANDWSLYEQVNSIYLTCAFVMWKLSSTFLVPASQTETNKRERI
ncbi:PREDICTED: inactive beta-amylase 4, chloroplastic-like isoform 2 [Fragaria vesca subsp. vesca]